MHAFVIKEVIKEGKWEIIKELMKTNETPNT